jgi:Mrp family chromosome partitioning ATPase
VRRSGLRSPSSRGRRCPISFLPAGTRPEPGDLLTTDVLQGFLGSLRTCFDWVIVDSPPIGAVPDALVLAPLADGVIVVVGAR